MPIMRARALQAFRVGVEMRMVILCDLEVSFAVDAPKPSACEAFS